MEVQVDVAILCNKLEELRQTKLHCDVNLQVGQQLFPCHKVVLSAGSEYFSNMFNENFKEGNEKNIVLNDIIIDADVFEKMLSFLYTGKITITDENSYALLVTSEYLGLQYLEGECVSYIITNNKVPCCNAIQLFIFAFNTGKTFLLNHLSEYIAENISTFHNQSKFLEIPFDALKIILNSAHQGDALLYAIICWVRHSYDQRKQVVPELLTGIDFGKVSAAYVQLLTECVINVEPAHQILRKTYTNSQWLPAVDNSPADKVLDNISPLNVYVASEVIVESKLMCYGVDKNYRWRCAARAGDDILNTKHVAHGEELHEFYCYRKKDKRGYALRQEVTFADNMTIQMKVKDPPVQTAYFDACSVRTNIYFYNQALSSFCAPTSAVTHFTMDELSRGIYSYNCELDAWYPVPEQKLKLDGSYLVSCNDVVYLLGGYFPGMYSQPGYVQSYDPRRAAWCQLPYTNSSYKNAAACVHDGKIYVAGGSCCPRGVEVFDPKAGKWETVKSMNCGRISHKLASYNNYLWAVGNATDLSVEIYNCKDNSWTNTTSMDKAVQDEETQDYWHTHKVLDAVVFEYYVVGDSSDAADE